MNKDYKSTSNPPSDTDTFSDLKGECHFDSRIDAVMEFVTREQLMDTALWHRFAEQFRVRTDSVDAGWRGEYWGKMMRGGCFVYSYTKDAALYDVLTESVKDILSTEDPEGRISSYTKEKEFIGWDIWSRKYVMLGLQYYLEICEDPALAHRIVGVMCTQADYLIARIGPKAEGKKPITVATNHWRGLNSSSILEPIVGLYRLTGREDYLSFAKYIVDEGCTSVVNIFRLALENDFKPYQYPITKAYEMISCFQGLLEYYRITGEAWMRQAILNFADAVLDTDFTVIGCSGCSSELFDHSSVRQSNPDNPTVMQETCVTVTLMAFFHQLMRLTGNGKYADAFERSFYNAYLGSVNTEHQIDEAAIRDRENIIAEPMPFDSYSPLTAGVRGNGIGGFKIMSDRHYYGCCACIGAYGIGLYPRMAFMRARDGFVINAYGRGSISCDGMQIVVDGNYPAEGNVKISVCSTIKKPVTLYFRVPAWSKNTVITVNGEIVSGQKNGYIAVSRVWANDQVAVSLDITVRATHTEPYGSQILMNKVIWGQNYMVSTFDREHPEAKNMVSLSWGPIALAVDENMGYDALGIYPIAQTEDGTVQALATQSSRGDCIMEKEILLKDGRTVTLVDYASAGKRWNNGRKIAVWLRVK